MLFSRQLLNGSQVFFYLILYFDLFSKYITIETHARTFLPLNILATGSVGSNLFDIQFFLTKFLREGNLQKKYLLMKTWLYLPKLYQILILNSLNSKGQKKSKLFFQFDVSSKKWTNSTLLLWNLRSTCFHLFFGGNWRHQKTFRNYLTIS